MLSQAYYDEHDKPMKGNNGCHKVTYKYDGNGNKIEEAYFGTDGKATLVNGVHLEKYTYDEKGNMTLYALYDQSGKPKNCEAGFQKIIIAYDNGTPSSRKYYTASGSLLATQSYNKTKGEWNSPQGTGAVSSYSASASDWRSAVRKADSECPVKVADGVYIQSVTSSSSNVTITIKLSDVSKYDMEDEMRSKLIEVSSQMKTYMRKALELPSNVTVNVHFVDKASRSI